MSLNEASSAVALTRRSKPCKIVTSLYTSTAIGEWNCRLKQPSSQEVENLVPTTRGVSKMQAFSNMISIGNRELAHGRSLLNHVAGTVE